MAPAAADVPGAPSVNQVEARRISRSPVRAVARRRAAPRTAGSAASCAAAEAAAAVAAEAAAPQVMGLTDAFYAMGSDGYVHALNVSNGADLFPPVKFIPENSKPSALLLVQQDFDANGTPEAGMLYTSTSGGCGATPNGVWAIDLASKVSGAPRLEDQRRERGRFGRSDAWHGRPFVRRRWCRHGRSFGLGRRARREDARVEGLDHGTRR